MTLNDTLDQLHLIDVYRTFHAKPAEYTFISSAHRMFSRIDCMLGHKTSLKKFKKIEIISSFFFNHSSMKLEISYRKKNEKKPHKYVETKQHATKIQWINEEIKEELEILLDK